jgi:hypothetical protein
VTPLLPVKPGNPSPLAPQPRDWDLLLTAETHNVPCAVSEQAGKGMLGGKEGVCRWIAELSRHAER